MAASAVCSNPHIFAHTLQFSARGFLALTKNAWFLEVPLDLLNHSGSEPIEASEQTPHIRERECSKTPILSEEFVQQEV